MYRCTICQAVSLPGEPLLRHIIYRTVSRACRAKAVERDERGRAVEITRLHPEGVRTEIAQELPVCKSCDRLLREGVPLAVVLRQRGQPIPTGSKTPREGPRASSGGRNAPPHATNGGKPLLENRNGRVQVSQSPAPVLRPPLKVGRPVETSNELPPPPVPLSIKKRPGQKEGKKGPAVAKRPLPPPEEAGI